MVQLIYLFAKQFAKRDQKPLNNEIQLNLDKTVNFP